MFLYFIIGAGLVLLLAVLLFLLRDKPRPESALVEELPTEPQVFTVFQPDPEEAGFCQVGDPVKLYDTHRSFYQVSVYRQGSPRKDTRRVGTIIGKPGKTLLHLMRAGRPYQASIVEIKKEYLDIVFEFTSQPD